MWRFISFWKLLNSRLTMTACFNSNLLLLFCCLFIKFYLIWLSIIEVKIFDEQNETFLTFPKTKLTISWSSLNNNLRNNLLTAIEINHIKDEIYKTHFQSNIQIDPDETIIYSIETEESQSDDNTQTDQANQIKLQKQWQLIRLSKIRSSKSSISIFQHTRVRILH